MDIKWMLGYSDNSDELPLEYFEAKVPGAVQLDYSKAHNMPDYRSEDNFKSYQWMQEKFWHYKTLIDLSKYSNDKNVYLLFLGIDYQFDVFVNEDNVYSYEGMYKKTKVDLTKYIGTQVSIRVMIHPYPVSTLSNVTLGTRDEANQCCKPPVSYGWDFHPRLIPLGIWDDVSIIVTEKENVANPIVSYSLFENRKKASVKLTLSENVSGCWQFFDPNGKIIFESNDVNPSFEIDNVLLWWCNGYGEPNLYSWRFTSDNGQCVSGKVGFRTVELVKAEETWKELKTYPMSRNTPPITVRLNGKNIFAKGSNWVAPEIFYGTINKERYLEQLQLAKDANLNFLRCWGGAIINKKDFFDICDEFGLMVWQEFPLACNQYVSTEHYLRILKNEAPAIVDRISSHPCLMMWCGGNELFNSWSAMDDQSLVLRYLNALTFEKTPEIPFLPTSPVMGMGHGAYTFCYPDGREAIEAISDSKYTAYTEFGITSFSTENTLDFIASKEELELLSESEKVSGHHIDHAQLNVIKKYFENDNDISSYIKHSQIIQALGLQFIFEEARRQKPYCSMVANWCLNEPWPCLANNSVVSYPNNLKPAYFAIKNACRPVLASAKIQKFSYSSGEYIKFDLSLLNDSYDKIKDGTIDAFIKIGDSYEEHLLSWNYKNVKIHSNAYGPTVCFELPFVEGAEFMTINLKCGDYSSTYVLQYKPVVDKKKVNRQMNVTDI